MTIIYFFLSEIIFREKMVSLSNNDRFDNDKIFLCNIWHFSVITINYVSIFFRIYLKDTWKNFVVNIWTIRNSYSEVQSAIYEYVSGTLQTFWTKEIPRHEQYKRFKWKRMRVANITKILNERECLSRTKCLGFKWRKTRVTDIANMNMKLYVRDRTSF